jgi:hypothetical protein
MVTGELEDFYAIARWAHIELQLSNQEYEEFQRLSFEEQQEQLRLKGEIVVDDFDVQRCGEIVEIDC